MKSKFIVSVFVTSVCSLVQLQVQSIATSSEENTIPLSENSTSIEAVQIFNETKQSELSAQPLIEKTKGGSERSGGSRATHNGRQLGANNKQTDGTYNGRPTGGGTTGSGNQCQSQTLPLTALVPGTKGKAPGIYEGVIGLTSNGHPTFWFYVPYSSNLSATFKLVDSKKKTVFQENYPMKGIPGIVKITLPKSAALASDRNDGLLIGENYRWSFSVLCDPQDPSADIYVDGWVQRVSLDAAIVNKLKSVTIEQQISLYAEANLWHERLASIIEKLYPTDRLKATTLLTEALRSVGRDESIAKQPIAPCCTSKK